MPAAASPNHPPQQVHINADATGALRIPANTDVVDVLKSLGNYQTFLLALQVRGPALHHCY